MKAETAIVAARFRAKSEFQTSALRMFSDSLPDACREICLARAAQPEGDSAFEHDIALARLWPVIPSATRPEGHPIRGDAALLGVTDPPEPCQRGAS